MAISRGVQGRGTGYQTGRAIFKLAEILWVNPRTFGSRQNRREEAGLSSHTKTSVESQKARAEGGHEG